MTFAVDFAGVDDLDIDIEVTDAAAVAEAVGRRITTPEGGVFYDPKYRSIDLNAYLNRSLSSNDITTLKAKLEAVIGDEARLASFTVDVDWYPAGFELRVTIAGVTVRGSSFELTATVLPDEGVQLAIAA